MVECLYNFGKPQQATTTKTRKKKPSPCKSKTVSYLFLEEMLTVPFLQKCYQFQPLLQFCDTILESCHSRSAPNALESEGSFSRDGSTFLLGHEWGFPTPTLVSGLNTVAKVPRVSGVVSVSPWRNALFSRKGPSRSLSGDCGLAQPVRHREEYSRCPSSPVSVCTSILKPSGPCGFEFGQRSQVIREIYYIIYHQVFGLHFDFILPENLSFEPRLGLFEDHSPS